MRRKIRYIIAVFLLSLFISKPAKADMFGGDVVVLTQILVQSIQTVVQLKSILENGADTLDLLQEVNSGVSSAVGLIKVIKPDFNPGVFGNLKDAENVMRAIQELYGAVPRGMDQELIQSQDQSVAEVIAMNRNLYDYADQVDLQKDQILQHAEFVSPQGAGRLQGQALGVMIGVMTQLLRSQSQMLKIMAQNMALDNRKEKVSTQSFQESYSDISKGFKELPKDLKLPRIGGDR